MTKTGSKKKKKKNGYSHVLISVCFNWFWNCLKVFESFNFSGSEFQRCGPLVPIAWSEKDFLLSDKVRLFTCLVG